MYFESSGFFKQAFLFQEIKSSFVKSLCCGRVIVPLCSSIWNSKLLLIDAPETYEHYTTVEHPAAASF